MLSVDDDFILEPEDIEFGYQRWKEHDLGRKRMAGFVARTVYSSKKQDIVYDAPQKDYRYEDLNSSCYGLGADSIT